MAPNPNPEQPRLINQNHPTWWQENKTILKILGLFLVLRLTLFIYARVTDLSVAQPEPAECDAIATEEGFTDEGIITSETFALCIKKLADAENVAKGIEWFKTLGSRLGAELTRAAIGKNLHNPFAPAFVVTKIKNAQHLFQQLRAQLALWPATLRPQLLKAFIDAANLNPELWVGARAIRDWIIGGPLNFERVIHNAVNLPGMNEQLPMPHHRIPMNNAQLAAEQAQLVPDLPPEPVADNPNIMLPAPTVAPQLEQPQFNYVLGHINQNARANIHNTL